ncbi:Dyp-type peroxidase [Azoarcus sp. TTM-91]|uniref:Dyp-type peroxidase n=1 Tax=Azoarcus sp. TTM-91 TaxID=2691581 RepID=UPI00145CDF41|nr:Dyp-type peroxidase [Azoarcus sp. TTM-91]NMG34959.1 Dyp-type peroxidase [Azoarcus sp. TTM-91]
MSDFQPGILAPVPSMARHLFFRIAQADALGTAVQALRALQIDDGVVVGLGLPLVQALGKEVAGLRVFPEGCAGEVAVPSTPWDLWVWLRGDDRGALFERARGIEQALAPALLLERGTDAFRYKEGRDLTGYEDGTENPEGEAALAAAFDAGGASFAAIQHWRHDFARFDAMSGEDQDNSIGRRRSDNEELEDAPESAHVKRTAQEDFDPEAFVLRRSMPWAEGRNAGLLFLAFGKSFDAFEAQLHRMSGAEDGVVDALYRFTRPLTGGYFWCPPVAEGRLDLSAIGC